MSAAVFFYGTLMSPEVRNRVIYGSDVNIERESKIQVRPAILKGYKRYALVHRDYPAVIFTGRDDDQVLGILCEGLQPKDLSRLDTFEGYEYMRQDVQVTIVPVATSLDDQQQQQQQQLLQPTVNCGVYIWIDKRDHLMEREWLLENFLGSGIQASWLNARCESYMVDQLEVHTD